MNGLPYDMQLFMFVFIIVISSLTLACVSTDWKRLGLIPQIIVTLGLLNNTRIFLDLIWNFGP